MKIVLVTDSYNGENGGCVATRRLAEGLKKRGHKVSIVATDVNGEGNYMVKGKCPSFMKESLEKMQFLFGVPEKDVLRKAFADADIIQIQLPFYLGYGAAKMARAMNKCFIAGYHVQAHNVVSAAGKDSKILDLILSEIFKFFLFKRVPVIQCPSRFAADLLRKDRIKCRLEVVSNGIPEDYTPRKSARPEWFGDNFVLMSLGRHAPEKRQLLLIEGVKRSKYADKINLLLCGRGEMSEKLIAEGAQLPVPPLVRFVTQEEKLQYLNTADLFIHASVVDLESLACLEAVGCGLPCLVGNSPHSAASQFSLDHRFSFEHDNADHLAEKINYWYENRSQLLNIREQVKVMAEQYRFEKCMDKMEKLYRETIRARDA
ncbi:MAG: glycosyltransferase [Verrucomicrobia bacterium]|nr:glycosyltransferase [Verrucomicrobiota bacterium]MBU1735484.1 glycosyltransferase [Verrucomicrobiota bacterium]MBU1856879.1 glycosyltransferase [Verrucomicrobiota bacterium]